jgi:hypothetical protein
MTFMPRWRLCASGSAAAGFARTRHHQTTAHSEETMSNNKDLWIRVCKTDPAAVKPITGKQYQGNSPKPYYIVERLTEEFGPCGLGWGFSVLHERFERFSDTDTLHVALIEFWYIRGTDRGAFQQMGQTKASYVTSKGVFMLDEDAPKKSVTDALVKCASYLGFAGDIFSGRWDDSKYVDGLKREFAEQKRAKVVAPPPAADKANAFPLISDERRAELDEIALYMIELGNEGRAYEAAEAFYRIEIESPQAAQEEMLHVWERLKTESALRRKVKGFADDVRKSFEPPKDIPPGSDPSGLGTSLRMEVPME